MLDEWWDEWAGRDGIKNGQRQSHDGIWPLTRKGCRAGSTFCTELRGTSEAVMGKGSTCVLLKWVSWGLGCDISRLDSPDCWGSKGG